MPTCIQLSNLRTQHYQGKPCSRATLQKQTIDRQAKALVPPSNYGLFQPCRRPAMGCPRKASRSTALLHRSGTNSHQPSFRSSMGSLRRPAWSVHAGDQERLGPTTGLPGWWINSFGSVSNAGHRYQVAILSSHQASQKIGISSVNRIARGINAAFARYPVKS